MTGSLARQLLNLLPLSRIRVFRTTALMLFHGSLVVSSAIACLECEKVKWSQGRSTGDRFPNTLVASNGLRRGPPLPPGGPLVAHNLSCGFVLQDLRGSVHAGLHTRDRNQSQPSQTADLLPRLSPMREFVRQSVLSARFAEALPSMFVRDQGLARRGVRERMSRNDRTIR